MYFSIDSHDLTYDGFFFSMCLIYFLYSLLCFFFAGLLRMYSHQSSHLALCVCVWIVRYWTGPGLPGPARPLCPWLSWLRGFRLTPGFTKWFQRCLMLLGCLAILPFKPLHKGKITMIKHTYTYIYIQMHLIVTVCILNGKTHYFNGHALLSYVKNMTHG